MRLCDPSPALLHLKTSFQEFHEGKKIDFQYFREEKMIDYAKFHEEKKIKMYIFSHTKNDQTDILKGQILPIWSIHVLPVSVGPPYKPCLHNSAPLQDTTQ